MPEEPQTLLLLVVLQNVVFLVATVGIFWIGVIVARALGKKAGFSLTPLGLSKPRGGILMGSALGFVVGIAALIMSVIINLASTVVLDRFGYPTENTAQEPLMQSVQGWIQESPQIAIPAAVFAIVIFGPAVEELVFRGAIFGGLYRLANRLSQRRNGEEGSGGLRSAPGIAAFVFAALVALLHFSPVILPALFVLAIVLCELYRRTGSLLPPFVAHATFNSFAVLVIILSGLEVLPSPV
jgi:membrane protease YdiL (CAAX protease family)